MDTLSLEPSTISTDTNVLASYNHEQPVSCENGDPPNWNAEATWKVSFVYTKSAYLQKPKNSPWKGRNFLELFFICQTALAYPNFLRSQCDPVQMGPSSLDFCANWLWNVYYRAVIGVSRDHPSYLLWLYPNKKRGGYWHLQDKDMQCHAINYAFPPPTTHDCFLFHCKGGHYIFACT